MAKPIFFRQDPEKTHDRVLFFGKTLGKYAVTRSSTAALFRYEDAILEQDVLGIHFKNPVGLAAGFDKNAELTDILPSVGFGFEEIGSITGEPCEGNAKPRLWRLPELQSLRVYYGLKNDGAKMISQRLSQKTFGFPVGVSVAKTNSKETVGLEEAIADYVKAYRAFRDIGSYDTINISCPNAFGGQPFSDPERLDALLAETTKDRSPKPIFIKLSPDLSREELHEIATIAKKYDVNGLICSNLKKKHEFGKGGLSGKPVADYSCKQLHYLYHAFPGQFVLVSVGGIFSGEDAFHRIRHGATLLQLATGMIYQGPQSIGEINRDLARLIRRHGFSHISEVIGSAYRS